jgi:single-stranded-DNA-specific exonuclease
MKVNLVNENFKSNYVENLLHARGIEDIEHFLNPDESCLQSWEDLDNIEKGMKLIISLTPNSRVGLVVDCDIDGFTSAAIIYQFLQKILPGISIKYYIHDGKAHGLEEHWEQIRDENFDLVIVPDAGSNDSQYAAQINCPILVIDHHLVEDTNFAPNMIVINNQLSPKYKNKNLSGAGMVYQFCRALDAIYIQTSLTEKYIDLAALGI